ncbi:4-hydroxysphinganine ceramide fatty acyl 2-hydroxylase [Acidiphilium sp. MT5]
MDSSAAQRGDLKWRLVEFFRHGSNAALSFGVLLWLLVAAFGAITINPLLVVAGAMMFFFSEYGFHRFALHAPPVRRLPFILKLQHRLHYDHHQAPERLDLLFLPLWFLVPNLAITAGLIALIWPQASVISALMAGVALAILYYEWVHFLAHIPYRPITGWGRWIKKYHLRHHFKNEQVWFGVTNPGFDWLLGTCPNPDAVPRSAQVRNLHRED